MKKIIVGLALTASVAQAQTPAATAQAPVVPVQTSTAEAPVVASKFGAAIAIESATGMQARKDNGNDAPVLTAWTLGLKYKVTKTQTLELQQIAYTRSNVADLGGDAALFPENAEGKTQTQALNDVVLKGTQKTDLRIFGSEPLSFGARYYIPTSKATKNLKRNGIIRADVTPAWKLSTAVTVDYAISPRIIFQKSDSKDGSDAIYRLVTGPSVTYDFNDNFNMYSAVIADLRSKDIGRGTVDTAKLQYYTPEIGANIVVGAFTINPALTSDLDLNSDSRAMALFTNESRVFAAETVSYNLNIYASF